MKEELAATSGVVKEDSCCPSLSKEEGVGRCMFRDQRCARRVRGLAGESLGHRCRPQKREAKWREKTSVPRAEEAGGCSSGERICLNQGTAGE